MIDLELCRRLLADLLGQGFLATAVVGSSIAAQRLSPSWSCFTLGACTGQKREYYNSTVRSFACSPHAPHLLSQEAASGAAGKAQTCQGLSVGRAPPHNAGLRRPNRDSRNMPRRKAQQPPAPKCDTATEKAALSRRPSRISRSSGQRDQAVSAGRLRTQYGQTEQSREGERQPAGSSARTDFLPEIRRGAEHCPAEWALLGSDPAESSFRASVSSRRAGSEVRPELRT